MNWRISKYILQSILPYFLFSWLLLTVVLFVQQASRQAEIFFGVKIPAYLAWQLTFALLPNVIAFTCPMACLVGVIIGLARLRSDSELTAIRASGTGNWQIFAPIFLLGMSLSLFAFFVNLFGVPFAAQLVRKITTQAALAKLDSPIDLRQFNTDIPNNVVYVRNGEQQTGSWQNIFIFSEDKNKQMRLITASQGRLNSSDDNTELSLEKAKVFTIDNSDAKTPVLENVEKIDFAIPSKRSELIKKLTDKAILPEEMGLIELKQFANQKEGRDKTEAELQFFRRITLSIAPLIFAFLGTALSLRFNRGGRSFSIVLALICLIFYYLLSLGGEQLARTGKLSAWFASILPVFLATMFGLVFFRNTISTLNLPKINVSFEQLSIVKNNRASFCNTGLLDFDILRNLFKYYFFTLIFFSVIYQIFTVFEHWKFTANLPNGINLLGEYLFYLVPFLYSQVSASCVMLAILTTYTLKSRANEVVTWISAGQSIYRLLLPCLIFCVSIGIANWFIQEKIMPESNRRQDSLRSQIRNSGISISEKNGQTWVIEGNRIFRLIRTNEELSDVRMFEFSDENLSDLKRIVFADNAIWKDKSFSFYNGVKQIKFENDQVSTEKNQSLDIELETNPLQQIVGKPAHLSSDQLKKMLSETESDNEKRRILVDLERKTITPFLPLVVMLITIPFALSLNRRGKVASVGIAVGLWLVYLAFSNTFENFGINGSLMPVLAVWSPLILFGLLGGYLLTKLKS
jgi:LPS export ABC transporter permease LptF/LPS export ABC transporter permease LptG